MGKASRGIFYILLWILVFSVIIFNNVQQLLFSIKENYLLLYAFVIIIFGVSVYAIKNKKEFKL